MNELIIINSKKIVEDYSIYKDVDGKEYLKFKIKEGDCEKTIMLENDGSLKNISHIIDKMNEETNNVKMITFDEEVISEVKKLGFETFADEFNCEDKESIFLSLKFEKDFSMKLLLTNSENPHIESEMKEITNLGIKKIISYMAKTYHNCTYKKVSFTTYSVLAVLKYLKNNIPNLKKIYMIEDERKSNILLYKDNEAGMKLIKFGFCKPKNFAEQKNK